MPDNNLLVKREHEDNDAMNNNEVCKCESPNIFKLLSIKSNIIAIWVAYLQPYGAAHRGTLVWSLSGEVAFYKRNNIHNMEYQLTLP